MTKNEYSKLRSTKYIVIVLTLILLSACFKYCRVNFIIVMIIHEIVHIHMTRNKTGQ